MAKHGEKIELVLKIRQIGTKLTQFDKLAIAVVPNGVYEKEVVLLTPEHLEQIAGNKGCSNRISFANYVNTGGDSSKLVCTATYKQEGELIGFQEDGVTPITSKETGRTVHSKSYWDLSDFDIEVGSDANAQIIALNERVAYDLALEDARASKLSDARAKERRADAAAMKGARDVRTTPVTTTPIVNSTPAQEDPLG